MNLKRGINLGGYLSQCDYSKEHLASLSIKRIMTQLRKLVLTMSGCRSITIFWKRKMELPSKAAMYYLTG